MLKKLLVVATFCLINTPTHASEERLLGCFKVDEVLKVVDGDTIDVRINVLPLDLAILADIRIRMEGINAWES